MAAAASESLPRPGAHASEGATDTASSACVARPVLRDMAQASYMCGGLGCSSGLWHISAAPLPAALPDEACMRCPQQRLKHTALLDSCASACTMIYLTHQRCATLHPKGAMPTTLGASASEDARYPSKRCTDPGMSACLCLLACVMIANHCHLAVAGAEACATQVANLRLRLRRRPPRPLRLRSAHALAGQALLLLWGHLGGVRWHGVQPLIQLRIGGRLAQVQQEVAAVGGGGGPAYKLFRGLGGG